MFAEPCQRFSRERESSSSAPLQTGKVQPLFPIALKTWIYADIAFFKAKAD
jgi:hypothetical protein